LEQVLWWMLFLTQRSSFLRRDSSYDQHQSAGMRFSTGANLKFCTLYTIKLAIYSSNFIYNC